MIIDNTNQVSTAIIVELPIGGGADGSTTEGADSAGGFTHVAVSGNQLLIIDGEYLRLLDINSRNLTTLFKPGKSAFSRPPSVGEIINKSS